MTRTVQQKSDETYLALVNNSLGKYLNPEETSILQTILGEARQALELPCMLSVIWQHITVTVIRSLTVTWEFPSTVVLVAIGG